MRRPPALLVLCCLALAGCGLGEGAEREGGAEVRVTRDFGGERLGAARTDAVREGETVMRLLRSRFDVETRYGGGFVQSIDGVAGRGPAGDVDWFYFVNGVEGSVGAAEYELSPGDVVQWDYRRWDGAQRVSAIVGAFPNPFRRGPEGRRFPVRVECEDAAGPACVEAKRRLRERGVRATGATIGTQGTDGVARIVVAKWPRARLVPEVASLAEEPAESGVFARVTGGGRRLELLAPDGKAARTASAGTGLVAAMAPSEKEIVWVVTALDERGLAAAARALDERALRDAYAVAASPRGVEKLPLRGR